MTAERIALWKRVSDDQQDTRSQTSQLAARVKATGAIVTAEFDLPDTSAFKGKQAAALAQVLKDVAEGKYTRVLAVSSSRFERRGTKLAIGYLLQLDSLGGRFEAVDNPLFGDLSSAGGWHVTVAATGGDHDYSVNISNAVKRGNSDIDRAGGYRGGRAPLGYRSDKGDRRQKKLVPDHAQAHHVVEIFTQISNGRSVPQVVAWLEARGVKKTNSSVAATVRRTVYRSGQYQVVDWEGVTRVHHTEPLVSAELWRAANASLDSRPSTGPKPRRPRQDDWSGVLKCGICNGIAYRSWSSGKVLPDGTRARRRVYTCRTCHRDWDADRTDAQVQSMLSSDTSPETLVQTVAPHQMRAERLEAIEESLRDLPRRNLPEHEEDALRAALRAERREVQEMPQDEPVRREVIRTGRSWGAVWDAMSSHIERVQFIRHQPIELRLNGRGMLPEVERVFIPTLVRVDTSRLPAVVFGSLVILDPDE